MAPPVRLKHLPCPECLMNRYPGGCRIGNNRARGCSTCNNWAQNVRRLALQELARTNPEDFERARNKVEADLYPQVYEDWIADHPESLGVRV